MSPIRLMPRDEKFGQLFIADGENLRAATVELLAMVDPLTSGKVAVFVSRQQAEAQSREAAERWLARLASQLHDAGIPHTVSVAVGPRRDLLRSVGERRDIDRVLLGTRARDPFRRWRRQSVAHLMGRPLVSVS